MLKRYLTIKLTFNGLEKPDTFTLDLLKLDETKLALFGYGRIGNEDFPGYAMQFEMSDKEPLSAKARYFKLRHRVLSRLGFKVSPFSTRTKFKLPKHKGR